VRKSWFALGCIIILIGFLALLDPQTSSAQATSDFAAFKADLQFVLGKTQTQAVLLFTPFGSADANFKKHQLHDTQILELCGGVQGKCGDKLGVNFGTVFGNGLAQYDKAQKFGMQWTLEIAARDNPASVISAISNNPSTTIVRIGVADSGIGFEKWNNNPSRIAGDYIDFLHTLSQGTSKTFYAIAGPNEPDIESWFAPECGSFPNNPTNNQTFYDCIGKPLAHYMTAVCDAKARGDIGQNVLLLSPAFNLTSSSFDGIYTSMKNAAGPNFDCIDAFAGNLYPAGQSMEKYWTDQTLDRFPGKLIITETGPRNPLSAPGSNPSNLSYNPNIFHLSPLVGIFPDPGRRDYAQIRADLVEQGYQAYCAIPEQQIVGSIGPSDIVKMFLALGGSAELKLSPILTLDYSLAHTPLFRDSERKYQIKSDLEEYWAYQEPTSTTYSQAELGSAPIESLLSESQRCAEGAKNLWAQDDMCTKLITPDACALYTFLIPNTSHTVKSLLAEYRSVGGGQKNITTTCKELEKSPEEAKKQLFTDLTQVPLTIESGHRLAFLVLSLKELKKNPNELFSFFAHGTPPRDEVLVVAFKIPDVITNKPSANTFSGSNSKAYPFFSDGAMLARDSLLTVGQQTAAASREAALKTTLTATVTSVLTQNAGNPIYCLDGLPPNGTGSTACKDQLVKALTDIVNAQNLIDPQQLDCVGPAEIDESFTIDEPSAVNLQTPKSTFSDELGAEIISKLFLNLGSTNTDKAVQQFVSSFMINKVATKGGTVLSGQTSLKSYLVYPVGYELAEVENVLANSFLTKEQIIALESDPNNNDRFEMFGGTTDLANTAASMQIFDPGKCIRTQGKDCMSSIDGTIVMGVLKQVQFLGAKLGYYLRAVQRTLAKEASGVQSYLTACKTTEEFLLDRCAGIGQKEPQQAITYCGVKELAITNKTTSLYKICGATEAKENCKSVDLGSNKNFLDPSSSYSLQIATRILDGATLVTTGSVVTMNPGQGYDKKGSMIRCRIGSHDASTGAQIWYLPANVPVTEVEKPETWNDLGSKLVPLSGSSDWTNLVISLQVKPGYYLLPTETFGCLSRGTIWIDKNGVQNGAQFKIGSSIIPVGVGPQGRNAYCAKASFNSNMPGGPDDGQDSVLEESYGCKIAKPGYDIMLNTSCGGLNGADDLRLWYEYEKAGRLPGRALYKQIFGREFNLPQLNGEEHYACDNLFPNIIREVDCSDANNSDVGSIAQFGKDVSFDIEYWNGSMVTFKLPSQEIWDAIQKAAARHSCDPLLVLAVAHSESSTYSNNTVSAVGAKGVWQFPDGSWDTWRTLAAASADSCNQHQPTTFTQAVINELKFTAATDIPSAADSACRKLMWLGLQKYPENQNGFVNAFAINGDNAYSQIWNAHTPQAKYVWTLWGKLRETLNQPAVPQPSNYPPVGWESCPQRRN